MCIQGKVPGQFLLVLLLNLRSQVEIQRLVFTCKGVSIRGDYLEFGLQIRPVPVAPKERECRSNYRAAATHQRWQAVALIHTDDPVRRPGTKRPNDKKQQEQNLGAAKQLDHGFYLSWRWVLAVTAVEVCLNLRAI